MAVYWKGENLNQHGIIVDKTPSISKGKKDIDTISIPGRNGFLTIDRGTYQPFVVSLECHARETADFDDIKSFLDGYGTISFDNEREYTGIVRNAIEFSKALMFKRFPIEFMVNPISEDIIKTIKPIITSATPSYTGVIEIVGGNAPIYPVIEITTTGDLTGDINGYTFTLNQGTYILDCKNQVIVDENGDNMSSQMDGSYPILHNGDNEVMLSSDGNITLFRVTYKKAYL